MLGSELEGLLESEVRTTILGHVQRGGTPTPFDRVLATRFGAHAAHLVAMGRSGVMVAQQKNTMVEVPFAEIANRVRTVPLDDPLVAAGRSVGTSFGV